LSAAAGSLSAAHYLSGMSRPSKKHHFVPQAQLRHFAADADRRFLFAFDKRTGRSFRTSILNAGSENGFNTVGTGRGTWNFEHLFQEVDTRSARLVGEIVSRRSLAWLTADDRLALADLFAIQLLRTHFSRTTPRHVAGQLREAMRQVGYDPDADPNLAAPDEDSLRIGAVKAFLGRHGHAPALLRLVPALYSPVGRSGFVISDHPVGRTSAFPYGDTGLTSPGVLVTLPVAPDLTVALHCPTIVARYERAADLDLEPGRKERIGRYRAGLRSGGPIAVDDDAVLNLNAGQLAQCARYLYSAVRDFAFAEDILRRRPELRAVESHISLGEMGHAPPARAGMPAGLHLVIFGPADHCMLAIEEVYKQGEGLTMRTRDVGLLAQVAADTGMLRADLYDDGRIRRSMGQAMVECFGEPGEGWFRVVHRDPALRALGKRLDGEVALG
jgi:hypothetical protein